MAGECVKMEEKRKDCEKEFQRVWDRLAMGDQKFEKLNDHENLQNLDIKEIKTQIIHLVASIGGLTKALWGFVTAICVIGVGFVIWYIQSK